MKWMTPSMDRSIYVLGGGEHAIAVLNCLLLNGHRVVGILDSGLPVGYR